MLGHKALDDEVHAFVGIQQGGDILSPFPGGEDPDVLALPGIPGGLEDEPPAGGEAVDGLLTGDGGKILVTEANSPGAEVGGAEILEYGLGPLHIREDHAVEVLVFQLALIERVVEKGDDIPAMDIIRDVPGPDRAQGVVVMAEPQLFWMAAELLPVGQDLLPVDLEKLGSRPFSDLFPPGPEIQKAVEDPDISQKIDFIVKLLAVGSHNADLREEMVRCQARRPKTSSSIRSVRSPKVGPSHS